MASSARIDELRKKFDENPRRYFAPLANEYRKAGEPGQAIFICEEYLPQQPGHMSGHIVYGQALYELDRHEDARTVFETALSLDPENLIALRHLGDIARLGGDPNTARMWYQRVLEADPRNEEIAQLMMSLLSSDPTPSSGIATTPVTPVNTDVVVDAGTYAEPEPQIEKSVEPLMSEAPRARTYEEPRPVSPHAPKESDLLDLDDFDLGGVPLSDLRTSKTTPLYMAAQQFDPSKPFDPSKASGISMPDMIDGQHGHDSHQHLESHDHQSSLEADALDAPIAHVDHGEHVGHDVHEAHSHAFESHAYDAHSPEAAAFEADPYALASDQIEKIDDTPIGSNSDDDVEPFVASFASASFTESVVEPAINSGSHESVAHDDFDSSFQAGIASSFEAPAEPVDHATDLHLGLSDDGRAETTVGDAPESNASADAMDGLETFEPGAFAATAADSHAVETEGFFESETSETSDVPPESFVASEFTQRELAESANEQVAEYDVRDSAPAVSDASNESQPHDDHAFGSAIASHAHENPSDGDVSSQADVADLDVESAFGSESSVSSDDAIVLHEVHVEETVESFSVMDSENGEIQETSVASVEVFETETMAQLYLEQGHLKSAREIYRKLVSQRPDDQDLVARMDAIEERMAVTADDDFASAPSVDESYDDSYADIAPAPSFGGPTIREFLSSLVNRMPTQEVAAAAPSDEASFGDTAGEVATIDEGFDAAGDVLHSDLDTPLDDFGDFGLSVDNEAHAAPEVEASADESVSGSFDTMFAGEHADASDEAAAETLARAFASETPASSPIASASASTATPFDGAPAHRAADELSLDHVFKGNQTPRTGSDRDGFSFDQFFADEVAEGSAETAAESQSAAQQGPDDIAQFNAWLNGLKKT